MSNDLVALLRECKGKFYSLREDAINDTDQDQAAWLLATIEKIDAALTAAQQPEKEWSDDAIRDLWRNSGGKFHGPHVETGTMPEENLIKFLRTILSANPQPQTEHVRVPVDRDMLDWLEENHFYDGTFGENNRSYSWKFYSPNNNRQYQPIREKIAAAMLAAAKESTNG